MTCEHKESPLFPNENNDQAVEDYKNGKRACGNCGQYYQAQPDEKPLFDVATRSKWSLKREHD